MISLRKEAPLGMQSFEPQSRHRFFVREAVEGVNEHTGFGNATAKLSERPSLDDREWMLDDSSRNEQVEQSDWSQAGLERILTDLDPAGGAVPPRLQLQAQRRFDQPRCLEIPGDVPDRRSARDRIDERIIPDSQRTLHRALLGMDQPHPAARACDEERETRKHDSP